MKNIDYYMSINYPIKLIQESDGTYFVSYPDLPGCFSCGDNIEEAIKMGEDARKEWTVAALENGIFIPEPKDAVDCPDNYKVHLPKTLYKQLRDAAAVEGCSMNQYCVYLLAKGSMAS